MAFRIFAFATPFLIATAAHAVDVDQSVSIEAVAAAQDRQLQQQSQIEYATAPIRSLDDLRSFLDSSSVTSSPLNAMSTAGKERFLKSLRFNEKGLTSFDYSDLETELTPTQIYRVLALFGAQRDAAFLTHAHVESDEDAVIMAMPRSPTDHPDYECAKRATCTWSNYSICTGNC